MRGISRILLAVLFASMSIGVAFGETQNHVYSTPGTYNACVTATDEFGASATECVAVTVRGNSAPDVALAATPSSGLAPLSVAFESTVTDPDGDSFTLDWSFGD